MSIKFHQGPLWHVSRSFLMMGWFVLSSLPNSVCATPEMDKIYAMRRIVPIVINQEGDPVFSEHVEDEMVRYLKSNSRFFFPKDAYLKFKERIGAMYLNDPKVFIEDKLEWMRVPITDLRKDNVDAVLVGEIIKTASQTRVVFAIATTNDMELIRSKDITVDDPFSFQSYSGLVALAMDFFIKQFPFDGTIIRRDGYRVVIDRGIPDVKKGQEITAHTLEVDENKMSLEETGLIRIVEPGEEISFGQIIVERRPKEITALNKVILNPGEIDMSVSMESNQKKFQRREFGDANFQIGASLVSVNNLTSAGTGLSDSDKFFPTARLEGELWMTKKMFIRLNLDFGFAGFDTPPSLTTMSATSLGASISDLRLQGGYRISFGKTNFMPTVSFRAGVMRHALSIDTPANSAAYVSTSHTGFCLGAGASVPVSEKVELGFDMTALVLPTFSEAPFTSGSETLNVTGWDLTFHSVYHLNDLLDIIGRLGFQSFRAEFMGVGTRPTPLASVSHSNKALFAGLAYYF